MDKIFNAFSHTPFDAVKVVILWQDPYHGPNQAHGLSFSVTDGVPQPPSLKNIFKEIQSDLQLTPPSSGTPLAPHLTSPSQGRNQKGRFQSGNLEPWADQGVLMLNAILTVQKWNPASHSKIGWETFTDAVIKTISDKKTWVVFLLWGNFARSKIKLIDTFKHHVLEAAHPSPLARGWFAGCKHFSKTNELLKEMGKEEIDWRI
jgi:uracil-DNA glycosylase